MKILVTGGAGYIGSFMVQRLLKEKHEVIVVDSLERGHKEVIPQEVEFIPGDLRDKKFVTDIFNTHSVDGVIHFAAYISMAESMQNPFIYFQNNIFASLHIVEAMREKNINNFIFSSTAGVYGNPTQIPIPEDHSKSPENPYGESKLMVEKILSWYAKTKGLSAIVLRYFNAAGDALDGNMGEAHEPETHIIPNIMQAVIRNVPFKLYGNDYNTPDGTCVRDYIHVLDLVDAHIQALYALQKGSGFQTYNVGTGKGYSNKEVIDMISKVTEKEVIVENAPRRPGDADSLVADVSRIQRDLQFNPKYSDLETIVKSAWKWHAKHTA